MPTSQMKEPRSRSLSQEAELGWGEDLWFPVPSHHGHQGLALAFRHRGDSSTGTLWPASPSVYPGRPRSRTSLSTAPPLVLALPSCREHGSPCVRESPQIYPRSSMTSLWHKGSAPLSGLGGCVVIGLGAMTHFSTLSRHVPSVGSLTQMIQILLHPVPLSLVICAVSQLCIIC